MSNNETGLKGVWNNYSKLDKLGFITSVVLKIGFLYGIIYTTYFSDIFINMLRLTYYNVGQLTIWNMIALMMMMFGAVEIVYLYSDIVDFIFYPETTDEKIIKKKSKEFRKRYPLEIARLKTKELEKQLELKKIKSKLVKLENEMSKV